MKHKAIKIDQRTTSGTVVGQTAESKVKIKFADVKLNQAYLKSRKKNPLLYKWLKRAFDDISENPYVGVSIPPRLIPKHYTQKYAINNLWKYNLPKGWRLLYSTGKEEIWIIALILEWLPHKKYERRFGY